MASKKKKKQVDPIQQTEEYIAFLRRALASENFKREVEEDETGKKKKKYEKYERSLEKEKLRLKFLKMDRK
jgi:hypothetical protein